LTTGATAGRVEPWPRDLFWVLRVAAAMCFIGHGAFGIITKPSWLVYLGVVGIGRELGYVLMPVIGVVDILLGLSMLIRPTKAALAYMTLWAMWTALLRPLAGQGFSETLERGGNYGVPLALLAIGLAAFPRGNWFAEIVPPPPTDVALTRRLAWILRVTTGLLLLGHGLLAAMGKPLMIQHLATLGVGDGGVATRTAVAAQGGFEIALALAVLAAPGWPLLLIVLTWKVATELVFPLTGDYIWEFVERGGSYGAPLALMILVRSAAAERPGTSARTRLLQVQAEALQGE
jgi:hypothetical protein